MNPPFLAVSVLLGALAAPPAGSQTIAPSGDYKALLAARSLKCSFPWHTSVDWDSGEPKVRTGRQEFDFHIDGIDRRQHSARIIGNAGADDLAVIFGDVSVSFVERVPVGSPNMTTVYGWRDEKGRFKAVHSRHTAIGGPSPSQNYGFCEVW